VRRCGRIRGGCKWERHPGGQCPVLPGGGGSHVIVTSWVFGTGVWIWPAAQLVGEWVRSGWCWIELSQARWGLLGRNRPVPEVSELEVNERP